jgi:integrase
MSAKIPSMLKVQRRHQRPCKKSMWSDYTKCSCPILIRGMLRKKRVSLSTAKFLPPHLARNLEAARDLSLLWEKAGEPIRPESGPASSQIAEEEEDGAAGHISIEETVRAFLADQVTQGSKPNSIEKHVNVFGRVKDGKLEPKGPQNLLKFAASRGLRFIGEMDLVFLREWRAAWTIGDLSRYKRQSQVLQFLRFCESAKWVQPGFTDEMQKGLRKVKYKKTRTDYFTREEYTKILKAASLYSDRPSVDKLHAVSPVDAVGSRRITAITELMRWTGLSIGMAATLERNRLKYSQSEDMWIIDLYREKTATSAGGGWVHTPIPNDVAEMLLNVPGSQQCPVNETWFFWSGRGKVKSVVSNWQRSYKKLFKMTGLTNPDGTPKRCHPHMFRDTFAVEHLLAGVPIEDVSRLLGHASVKETEKSYLPWVMARQTNLHNAVRQSWAKQGKVVTGKVLPISRAG